MQIIVSNKCQISVPAKNSLSNRILEQTGTSWGRFFDRSLHGKNVKFRKSRFIFIGEKNEEGILSSKTRTTSKEGSKANKKSH